MSGDENTDVDDVEDEVVVVDTKKDDDEISPLKEISNFGANGGWSLDDSYNLVKIVDDKGAHVPGILVEETWNKVVDDFNQVWSGKPYSSYHYLKKRYEKLLAQSIEKDPDSESLGDDEAKLWSLLVDHRKEIKIKNRKKAEGKKKKDSDAELIRQGKEERDIASVAVINNTVTRLGGKEWVFKDGKVVAKKEDGSEFEVKIERLGENTNGGVGGHGATAAAALLEIAKARQASEETKFKLMVEEAKLKEAAEQRRHEAEMTQREQQFQLQMQQFQLQYMTMCAQLSQSGIPLPSVLGGAFGSGIGSCFRHQ